MGDDTLALAATQLKRLIVRDKAMRLLQYAAKINHFASPERQKVMAAVVSALGDSRRAFRLWKWLEGVQLIRNVKAETPLLYSLSFGRHSMMTAFWLLDNFLWCAYRGIWSPKDTTAFKRLTYTFFALGVLFNALLRIATIQHLRRILRATNRSRVQLLDRASKGEKVQGELDVVDAEVDKLQSKMRSEGVGAVKDALDVVIGYDLSKGGVFDQNVTGTLGLITSAMALKEVW